MSLFFVFLMRSKQVNGDYVFFQAEDGIRDGRVTGVQTCALPISPHGIRVNAICPGIVVDTAMRTAIEAQQRRYGLPETAEREKSIPIGRVSVPDDVARIAAFLASDEASYMTGGSINLSG